MARTAQQIQNEIRQIESDAQDQTLGPDDQERLTELQAELSQVGSGASPTHHSRYTSPHTTPNTSSNTRS